MPLCRSNDTKVSNLVVGGSSKIKNAFGLPAGISCPGKTKFCKKCYAERTEKFRRTSKALVYRNYDQLLACNGDVGMMFDLLDKMIAEFRKDCERRGAPKFFRIHWDGDFFSDAYAEAWALIVEKNDDIEFWVYTRVESAAHIMHNTRATLYFSGDAYNEDACERMIDAGINIAYVHETFDDGRDAMQRLNIRAVKCPENNKKIPLISDSSSACGACRVCIEGRNNVLFAVQKNKPRVPEKKLKVVT